MVGTPHGDETVIRGPLLGIPKRPLYEQILRKTEAVVQRESKANTQVAKKHRKCANIFICMLRVIVLSVGLFVHRRSFSFFLSFFFNASNLSTSRCSHLVRYLAAKSRKRLVHDAMRHVCHIYMPALFMTSHTQPNCLTQNGSSHSRVFATYDRRFLTN